MLPRAVLLFAFAFVLAYGYSDDYNRQMSKTMVVNEQPPAVFCYINGSRLEQHSQQTTFPSNYFTVNNIKIELCTHIIYGAARLDPNTWDIKAFSNDFVQARSGNKITFDEITEITNRNSRIKVLISVSGSASDFSNMAAQHRLQFARNAVDFVRRNHFDGMNIDWQYPTRRGGNDADKQNFAQLMKDVKTEFRNGAIILSASVSPIRQNVLDGYDLVDSTLMDAVDYWFIMATEYYGHGDHYINSNAPIENKDRNLSVKKTVETIRSLFNENKYKLILVIPFYGKQYQMQDNIDNYDSPFNKEIANQHVRHGPESPVLSMTYRDVCRKLNKDQGWRKGWDETARVPWMVKDKIAVVYENAQSVREKTLLALHSQLGGVMAYSLDMDDYNGDCKRDDGRSNSYNREQYSRDESNKYPLLQSIYDTVQRYPNSAALRGASLAVVLAALVCVLMRG